MKKEILFVFIFLLLISVVSAQNAPGLDEAPLVGDIQKIQEGIQNKNQTSNQTADDYLKKEWASTLEKNSGGRAVLKVSSFFENLNFLFKAILGVDYSLSWSFIFAVGIWVILFVLIYPILAQVFEGKTLFGVIGAAVIVSLVGLAGVIRKAVDVLNVIIKTIWIALIALVIVIIIALIVEKFGKKIGKKIGDAKEKSAKDQTKKDREIIHTDAEVSKENLEGYKDGDGI